MVDIVRSHMMRIREGKELLQTGKPLSEMKTPQVGFSEDDIRE